MIITKLILLEGLPGSGKTTMAKKLFDRIDVKNKQLVQESSDHTIAERGIADIDIWQVKTARNWERLSAEIDSQQKLYVMEFVWFQNTIAEMLLKNCHRNQIVGFCRRVENIIKDIPPVLILYTANDAETFLRETYELRGDVWKEQIDSLIDDTPYGRKRDLTGFDGFMEFFNEYVSIVNAIYDELQIDRISIDVTKREWPKVEKLTYEFLEI
jgi:tRNA uridine 5-carbamoylmethylation protein Kti12